MTVTLTDAGDGGLFDRLGNLGGGLLDIIALLGGTATSRVGAGANWVTRANDLDSDYGASPQNRKSLDGLFGQLASWQQSQLGFASQLKTIAQNTLVEMVNDDTPLATKTVAAAMAILIQQMTASGDDVNAGSVTVGSQASVGSPTGTPFLVVSALRKDGRTNEYVFAETLRFTCTSDRATGATENRETMTVTSPASVADALAWNWPGGSGVNRALTIVDPSQDASGNLLTNSDFEDFTSNTPDNWVVATGVAGTDILAAGSGDAFDSTSNALEFTYDAGAPLSSVTQTFGTSAGTTATLKPNTVYLFSFQGKKTSGLTGNGTIQIGLVDGSGTLLTDDAGNSCAFTQTAAGLDTSYGIVRGAIVTPKSLPSTYKLRVRMSVAIADSAKSVFIDNLAMAEGTELYTGGVYAAVFPGATPVVKGDAYTLAISHTWGAFQQLFQRFFDMRALGLQLPSDSAAGETLADSLIA